MKMECNQHACTYICTWNTHKYIYVYVCKYIYINTTPVSILCTHIYICTCMPMNIQVRTSVHILYAHTH